MGTVQKIITCGPATADRPAPLFGVGEFDRAIANLPDGALKVKVRLRQDDFALAYLKTADSVTEYILCEDVNGAVVIAYPQGSNVRLEP